MIRAVAAAGSQPAASAAADALLELGGSAVDAVLGGFFCAAGLAPDVLLAPAVALVAGFGVGARAFDGRAAQPGRAGPRPRGFVNEADITPGAWISAPRSLAMLMLLHTYRGRLSLREVMRAGVTAAESAGAAARAVLLRRISASGVLALRTPEVERLLLSAGGPVAGGILTSADLEESAPGEAEAAGASLSGGIMAYTPPFPPADEDRGEAEVIVACDSRGVVAALSYVPARRGITIPELDIAVGREAIPVRRGVTRVAPGTPLLAPAPLLALTKPGGFIAAVGLPGRPFIEPASAVGLADGTSIDTAIGELRDRAGGRSAIAVLSDGRSARSASA